MSDFKKLKVWRKAHSLAMHVDRIAAALNSGSELEYHLIAARDTMAISPNDYASLLEQTVEVKKMLHGLLIRVKTTE